MVFAAIESAKRRERVTIAEILGYVAIKRSYGFLGAFVVCSNDLK